MALQQYASNVLPIASGWGTNVGTGTQQMPRSNPVTMAAGGAMSGAALAPMLGMAGPMGAMIGGGMGLLGGLL